MKNLYRNIFSLFFAGASISVPAQTSSYNYTGGLQTYTVPVCVTSITVDVLGARGGNNGTYIGGLGGRVQATIPVTPGEILNIYVGQIGVDASVSSPGVYNGGGAVYSYVSGGTAGTGGGASDIRRSPYSTSDRLVVSGGGGGGGYQTVGGNGGGLTGQDGVPYPTFLNSGGKGGTQTTGGAAGIACCSCPTYTTDGAFFQGGNGSGDGAGGGGGGGGWYGGGGSCFAGGGGGSSYTDASATSVIHTQGYQNGSGQVVITAVSGVPNPGAITGSTTICANASGNYSIASMFGATSYTWTVPTGSTINSGQGTTAINITAGNTSGNISVTATYPCGTSGPTTLALTINPSPTVGFTISPSSAVCAGSSVTLSGTGASSYSWSGGITDAVSFIPISTTTYTVTGTSAGCTNTSTVSVTVNAIPTVVANSTASAICMGSSVTLTGSGANSYTWTGGVIDAVAFSPTTTDTYTVTGTDSNGCQDSDVITVTVNGISIVTANSTASAICMGSSVTLTGSGANSYTWTGGVINAVAFSPTTTDTYTVTGTDSNGCQDTDAITVIVNSLPTVTAAAANSVVCIDDAQVVLTGNPVGGIWNGPGVTGSSFNPSSAGVGAQIVTYTFTDGNGCTGTATANIQVNACVGVVETTLASGVTVFPNPNNGSFTISTNANIAVLELMLTDIQGRVVFSSMENNIPAGFAKQISLENESAGLYLLHISANGEQKMEKISIQK